VVDEQDEACPVADDVLDQAEDLWAVEPRTHGSRVGSQRTRGDELAQVPVALRALDQRDDAAFLARRVGDLGADDRTEGSARALAKSGTVRRTVAETGAAMARVPLGYVSKTAAPCYL
jgi:hypothetical protein